MESRAMLWFKQAEADLKAAEHSMEHGDWFASAFWAHQAAEKALKALLLSRGKVARGHNLLQLAEIIRVDLGMEIPEDIMRCLRRLNPHYTIARYPNAANAIPYQIYDREDAVEAINYSRRVLEWVRRLLP